MEGRNYEGKELGREELGRIRKEGIRKGLIPCDLVALQQINTNYNYPVVQCIYWTVCFNLTIYTCSSKSWSRLLYILYTTSFMNCLQTCMHLCTLVVAVEVYIML